MKIKYTFNDGAVLILHDVGLSDDEVLELEDIHGKCVKVVTYSRQRNNQWNTEQENSTCGSVA